MQLLIGGRIVFRILRHAEMILMLAGYVNARIIHSHQDRIAS